MLIVVDIYCDVRGIRGLHIRGLHVSGVGGRPGVDHGGSHHSGHPYHHAVPHQQRGRSPLFLGRKSYPLHDCCCGVFSSIRGNRGGRKGS